MNKRLPIYLSIVFGILLIGIWLYIVDFDKMLGVLQKVNVRFLFPLVIVFTITYFLRSLRWKIILSPVEQITSVESFNLCMINYLINFLIPVHAGELVKSALLKKMKGTPISKSLPSVYVDKVTDLMPIILLLILAPFLNTKIRSISYLYSGIFLFILFLFAFALIFIVYNRNLTLRWMEKMLFFLPDKFKIRLKEFTELFIIGLSSIPRSSYRITEVIGLTILALIFHCLFMWLFFYSFGVSLPLITVLVGYSLLNASFILPAPPGFSGSLELTFVLIFTYLFGYEMNLVSAIAASSHVFIAVLFGISGFSCIALIGTKLSFILKTNFEKNKKEFTNEG